MVSHLFDLSPLFLSNARTIAKIVTTGQGLWSHPKALRLETLLVFTQRSICTVFFFFFAMLGHSCGMWDLVA